MTTAQKSRLWAAHVAGLARVIAETVAKLARESGDDLETATQISIVEVDLSNLVTKFFLDRRAYDRALRPAQKVMAAARRDARRAAGIPSLKRRRAA